MYAEIFGVISGALVFVSAIPYFINMFRDTNEQHPVSWVLWAIIGFALLVTYQSSGASLWSLLPVIQGVANPVLVLAYIFFKKYKKAKIQLRDWNWKALPHDAKKTWNSLARLEKACLILGLVSIGVWSLVRDNAALAQWTLYLTLTADVCAAIPTIQMLRRDPSQDKPGAWGLFTAGFVFALLSVTKPTIANYALPIYMIGIYGTVTYITAAYRLKIRAPFKEWWI